MVQEFYLFAVLVSFGVAADQPTTERLIATNLHADVCVTFEGVITTNGDLIVNDYSVRHDAADCKHEKGLSSAEIRLVEDALGTLRQKQPIIEGFRTAKKGETGLIAAHVTGYLARYHEGDIYLVNGEAVIRKHHDEGLDQLTVTPDENHIDQDLIVSAVKDFCRRTKSPALALHFTNSSTAINFWSKGSWTQEL